MNRRLRAWIVATAALALLPGLAAAQDPAASVVDQLRAQGYVEFTVSRTLLGRVQVIALRPEGRREIVFNPATGEILRDYWQAVDGTSAPRILDRGDDSGGRSDDDPDDGETGGGDSGSGDDGDSGSGGGDDGDNSGPGSGEGGGGGGDEDSGRGGDGEDRDRDEDDNSGRGGGDDEDRDRDEGDDRGRGGND